jgi:hypothetical protein
VIVSALAMVGSYSNHFLIINAFEVLVAGVCAIGGFCVEK